jgi:hypothetical protein
MNSNRDPGSGPGGPSWGAAWSAPSASLSRSNAPLAEQAGDREKKKKKKDRKKDNLGSARGIETVFRTSYRTHIDMSQLADNKANIMVTVNALILSISLASIAPKIDANPWLLIPTAILLLTTLVSLFYAVQAARPRVTNTPVSLEEVRQNRANILFFGNFVHLREDEYVQGMTELLQNSDRLYLGMLRDIYSLGGVLQQKFRLLRVSYNIFMFGLALAVLSFLIVLVLVVVVAGNPVTPVA